MARPTPPRPCSPSTGCGTCRPATRTCCGSRARSAATYRSRCSGAPPSAPAAASLVTPLEDRSSVWWVVVLSDEGLSTPSVYQRFDVLAPDAAAEPALPDALIAALAEGYADEVGALLHNDLWPAARDLRPDLVDTEEQLRLLGPDGVLLSGSGPTLLMLHEDVEEARNAVAEPDRARAALHDRPRAGRRRARGDLCLRPAAACSTWSGSRSPTASARCSPTSRSASRPASGSASSGATATARPPCCGS
ncbi:hypothetical protein [Nocardioides convexus]|uniref:hypothetical protein n=1 Tax=Nocardioides convexus TaxID=2712224 RepID=UPI0031016D2E